MRNSTISPVLDLAGVLASAWPGVRINSLELKELETYGDQDRAEGYSCSLSVSAPLDSLVQHGLLGPSEVAAIPRSGVIARSRFTIKRGKHLARVTCYWTDPDEVWTYPDGQELSRSPRIQRIVDRTAEAIATHALRSLR